MNRIFMANCYKYPSGDAGSVRQNSFAKIYNKLGFDVTVIGMGPSTEFTVKENDGIKYISFRYGNSPVSKLKNYFLFAKNLKSFLYKNEQPELIQVVDIPFNALFFLKKYANKHNIKLIHDSVEWYSPEQFKNGKRAIPYILKDKYNTKWIDKQFSVIAISTFLEKHFTSRGINTVRIPVIMDIDLISCEKHTDNEKTVFLYAGSPGKKDYLAEIIKGFSLLDKHLLSKTEFRILGINREQLVSLCGVEEKGIEYMGGSLVCLGKVSRDEVLKNLQTADFTVLLRSQTQRYAKAGFPTKVVESLATATPVVANVTSDLGLYLKDGVNSKIIVSCTPESFAKSVTEILNLTVEEKSKMYSLARKTAKDNFDLNLYTKEIEKILTW